MGETQAQKRRGRPPVLELKVPADTFDVPEVLEDGTPLPPKARDYLRHLAACGTATHALKRAGTSWSQLLRWRKNLGDGFAKWEEAARQVALDGVEHFVLKAATTGAYVPAATARLAQFILERRRDSYARPATRSQVDARVELAGAPNWVAFLLKSIEADEQGADGADVGAGDSEAPAGEGMGG